MNQEQPHIVEAEYYPDGTQKRYYKKVEQKFPQIFQLVIGLSAIAIALSALTITYNISNTRSCDGNISSRH
jgi:hypothetical protein